MGDPTGEADTGALRLDFDRRLLLGFRGSAITSDAGLLPYRELDDAVGLTETGANTLADARTGKNGRHRLAGLLRQSIFGRLAGYEDVNDADRLCRDPAMRWVVGVKHSWEDCQMPQSAIPPGRHAPVRADWLDKHREEALEPGLPIVDPHHHMWDRPGNRYLFENLLADVGSGHNIAATCFEECREMYRAEGPQELKSLGETEFVNGISAMSASGKYGKTRCIAGIIGNVDLRIGSRAKAILGQHVTISGGRFKGIRNGATWHDDPSLQIYCSGAPQGLYRDRNFREGFAGLASLGLSFDAWLFQTQLDDLTDLARAFPQATIVLNHVGGPLAIGPYAGKREEAFAVWKKSIGDVAAASPNTYVKLGGLGMKLSGFTFFENEMPPSSQDLEKVWRPYIETCIEAFGPQRSMFESNFPVDKGMCSYPVMWNAFKRITAGCSAAEKTALFSGAATAAYRLGL